MSIAIKRHNNKKKSNGKRSSGTRQLHQDLKGLMELQKAQEIRFIPEVPDVPRIRFSDNQLYNIELSYTQSITTSATAPVQGGLAFALNSCANYSAYTTAFDQYRIIQVNVKFLPGPSTTVGNGQAMLTALDYDDVNAPTSQATFFGYKTLKVTPYGQIDERTLTPRIATAAYQGSVFSAYANMPSTTFIDSASPTVQYYGLKYYIPTVMGAPSVNVIVTCMIQFKAQRAS